MWFGYYFRRTTFLIAILISFKMLLTQRASWRLPNTESEYVWTPTNVPEPLPYLDGREFFHIAPTPQVTPVANGRFEMNCRLMKELFANTNVDRCVPFQDLGLLNSDELWKTARYRTMWRAFPQDIDLPYVVDNILKGKEVNVVSWRFISTAQVGFKSNQISLLV